MSKIDILKEKGYRITKSRKELVELFNNNPSKHFTIDDIINHFNKDLNIATLYNNLSTFLDEEIINEIYIKDKKYYELNDEMHSHLKCTNCKEFFNIELKEKEKIQKLISLNDNVKIDSIDIILTGLCEECSNQVEFNLVNEFDYDINKFNITDYVKYIIKEMNINNKFFSLVFVDNDTMLQLNTEYREKNYVTDVLTFCDGEDNYLGDVIICFEKMQEQAKEYNHSEQREMLFLITHGFLHLLGYDHIIPEDEKIMFDIQEKLLNKYGVKK